MASDTAAVDDAVLAAVVKGASDLSTVFDDTGTVVYVNDVVESILGWQAEDLIGTSVFGLTHPDDLERAMALVAASLENGPTLYAASLLRLRCADGSYRLTSVAGNVLPQPDGSVFLSAVARPADELVAMRDSLRGISNFSSVHAVFEILPDFMRRQIAAPMMTIVLDDESGLHQFGDAIEPWLCGLGAGSEDSPWTRAWAGAELRGTRADLPPSVRDVAVAQGLDQFWVRPVLEPGGSVTALVTLWYEEGFQGTIMACQLVLDLIEDTAAVAVAVHQQHRRLLHAARHDSLTGLVNHSTFYEALGPVDRGATNGCGRGTAVLYIDLDGFKPVNDRWGHQAGDAILSAVARRLAEISRARDVVARLGGDEFAVLCKDVSADDAMALAERFLDQLRQPFEISGGEVVHVGASVGVAITTDGVGPDLATRADAAMFRAKQLGGWRVVVADDAFVGS